MWLNEIEFTKLQFEAERQGVAMSEIMRDYIRNLPEPKNVSQDSHS
ncbi:hypothetical protein [Nostoc sp. FACHB-888]|nr:hypothetical protein [Nostoc sp. FACHB-888]MBD2248035.1 hypothetical protein [Nostoc sp. FACHB-888]